MGEEENEWEKGYQKAREYTEIKSEDSQERDEVQREEEKISKEKYLKLWE